MTDPLAVKQSDNWNTSPDVFKVCCRNLSKKRTALVALASLALFAVVTTGLTAGLHGGFNSAFLSHAVTYAPYVAGGSVGFFLIGTALFAVRKHETLAVDTKKKATNPCKPNLLRDSTTSPRPPSESSDERDDILEVL